MSDDARGHLGEIAARLTARVDREVERFSATRKAVDKAMVRVLGALDRMETERAELLAEVADLTRRVADLEARAPKARKRESP